MRSRPIRHDARASRRAGASAVEMAFVAPVLLLIVFGLFEIAHAFMVQHLIQDAARQGCRVGISFRKTNAMVQDTINRLLQAEGIAGANTTITVNGTTSDVSVAPAGADIQVRITLAASQVSLFPGSGYLTGQLTATSDMRHE